MPRVWSGVMFPACGRCSGVQVFRPGAGRQVRAHVALVQAVVHDDGLAGAPHVEHCRQRCTGGLCFHACPWSGDTTHP